MRKGLIALSLAGNLLACGNPAPISAGATTGGAGTVGLSNGVSVATAGSSTSGAVASSTTGGSVGSGTTSATGTAASGTTTAGAAATSTTGSSLPTVPDPTVNGRYNTVQGTAEVTSTTTNDTIPLIYYYPAQSPDAGSPAVGSCPVVVFAHGFLIDASGYETYASHLASFGYVVVLPNYPDANEVITSSNDDAYVQDLLAGLQFVEGKLAEDDPNVTPLVDTSEIGISGHSLGGKLAILAAEQNPTIFKASIDFDPVDDVSCGANCPSATASLGSLSIPTAFLGETTDQSGGGIFGGACAPASENFQIFYDAAVSPSYEGTVLGAGSESFIDNPAAGCGEVSLGCMNCTNGASTNTLEIAHASLVAFYERYLRGNTGYDAWLGTGSLATSTWVTPGQLSATQK